MGRREAADIQYEVLEEFRYQIRRFLSFSERAARRAGIEPHQHQALLAIKAASRRKNATIRYLAERLLIRHHSAVELSDRLERKRLVRRSRGKSDRRQVFLSLTARGEQLLQRLSELHRNELQSAGPRLIRVLQAVETQAQREAMSKPQGRLSLREPGSSEGS
jgi:DNA-binding MarR family transcriptional regulator